MDHDDDDGDDVLLMMVVEVVDKSHPVEAEHMNQMEVVVDKYHLNSEIVMVKRMVDVLADEMEVVDIYHLLLDLYMVDVDDDLDWKPSFLFNKWNKLNLWRCIYILWKRVYVVEINYVLNSRFFFSFR